MAIDKVKEYFSKHGIVDRATDLSRRKLSLQEKILEGIISVP